MLYEGDGMMTGAEAYQGSEKETQREEQFGWDQSATVLQIKL